MSDDKKEPDGSEKKLKTYSEEEFKEVVSQRQTIKKQVEDLEKKLKAFEEVKKTEEEKKALEEGKYKELLEAQKKDAEALKLQLEAEKKEADAYRDYRKLVVEKVKEKLGDKWLPEYESFSLESLSKVAGSNVQLLGVDTTPPSLPPKEFYTKEEVSRMTQAEVNVNLEKVNKSMATWK